SPICDNVLLCLKSGWPSIVVQSSLYHAEHAGDGNRDANYFNPWWRVDLGKVYSISKVAITNRGDLTFEFEPVNGRYVNIFLPGNDEILTLCEVEVFADSYLPQIKKNEDTKY
uniref:Fucolectin tachylectin-4 pentraxin-1 domain-containing protein n=1 Tax=Cyprinus carpio TaxID=7962 RepID=A0A8C1PTR9_CYPCA